MVIQYIIHIEIWSEASLHFFNMNLETDFNQLQGNLQNMSIWVSGKGHKQIHWLNMMVILMWMNLAINYNFQTHPYPLFIDRISMVDGENPMALMVLFKNSKVLQQCQQNALHHICFQPSIVFPQVTIFFSSSTLYQLFSWLNNPRPFIYNI